MTPVDDALGVTNVLLATVALITAVLSLPPLLVRFWHFMSREKSAAELEVLRQIAMSSVAAIEQTKWKNVTNEEKLASALELAETQLAAYGMKVEAAQLRAAIEAAVLLTKAGLNLPPPPVDPNLDPATTPGP